MSVSNFVLCGMLKKEKSLPNDYSSYQLLLSVSTVIADCCLQFAATMN